jgi:MFS transporter, ACS family, tartrate transporter
VRGLWPALQMLGAPLAAGILLMNDIRGLRGWQWIFLIEGSTTVGFALVLAICLPRGSATAWFLKPAERIWLALRQERLVEIAKEKDPTAGAWHSARPSL